MPGLKKQQVVGGAVVGRFESCHHPRVFSEICVVRCLSKQRAKAHYLSMHPALFGTHNTECMHLRVLYAHEKNGGPRREQKNTGFNSDLTIKVREND